MFFQLLYSSQSGQMVEKDDVKTNPSLHLEHFFHLLNSSQSGQMVEKDDAKTGLVLHFEHFFHLLNICLLYTSPSPRDRS